MGTYLDNYKTRKLTAESLPSYHTNFFAEPPYTAVTNLQDFEQCAQERLKVLRVIENVGLKCRKYSTEYTAKITDELRGVLGRRYIRPPPGPAEPAVLEDDKKRDVLSHFILQMVFSRSDVSNARHADGLWDVAKRCVLDIVFDEAGMVTRSPDILLRVPCNCSSFIEHSGQRPRPFALSCGGEEGANWGIPRVLTFSSHGRRIAVITTQVAVFAVASKGCPTFQPVRDVLLVRDFSSVFVRHVTRGARRNRLFWPELHVTEVDRVRMQDCGVAACQNCRVGLLVFSSELIYRRLESSHRAFFLLRKKLGEVEDQKRWFVQQEADLFRYRLGQESGASLSRFIADNQLGYTPLPAEDFNNLRGILEKSTFHWSTFHGQSSFSAEFYKMDFLEALHLVRQRHAFLNQGYAFVPRHHLVEVVASRFREQLSQQMAVLTRSMMDSQEDERLVPLFNRLATGYTGKDYSCNEVDFGIKLENLNQLAVESFPLCARGMHDALRREHHLRHWARLQYGLFLKGIGLPLEDSQALFRSEFSQHGQTESQLKQQDYNIRHSYGKEGRRTNYTPPSCMKIITTGNPPAQGEYHGCPYKHYSPGLLSQKIKGSGIGHGDTEFILDLVKNHHYQHACTKYFEVAHVKLGKKPDAMMPAIEHPNQYFEESRRLLHPESVKDKPPVFARRGGPVGSQGSSANGNIASVSSQPQSQSSNGNKMDVSELDMDLDFDDELMASVDKAESAALQNNRAAAE